MKVLTSMAMLAAAALVAAPAAADPTKTTANAAAVQAAPVSQTKDLGALKAVVKAGEDVKQADYLAEAEKLFKSLDKNKNGRVDWRGLSGTSNGLTKAPEAFPAAVLDCFVIKYEKQPAKTEKVPDQPGVYNKTPAKLAVVGWDTWRERLLAQSQTIKGACLKTEKKTATKCAGQVVLGACFGGTTTYTYDECVSHAPDYNFYETLDAFKKLAALHFDTQDQNFDDVLGVTERNTWFCQLPLAPQRGTPFGEKPKRRTP